MNSFCVYEAAGVGTTSLVPGIRKIFVKVRVYMLSVPPLDPAQLHVLVYNQPKKVSLRLPYFTFWNTRRICLIYSRISVNNVFLLLFQRFKSKNMSGSSRSLNSTFSTGQGPLGRAWRWSGSLQTTSDNAITFPYGIQSLTEPLSLHVVLRGTHLAAWGIWVRKINQCGCGWSSFAGDPARHVCTSRTRPSAGLTGRIHRWSSSAPTAGSSRSRREQTLPSL